MAIACGSYHRPTEVIEYRQYTTVKQAYEVIPNVPLINETEWSTTLDQIQQPFFRLGKLDDAIETLILSLQADWTIILHWLIRKKWKKNHRIPPGGEDYELLGEMYFRVLELCIQVHAYNPSGYHNAAEWFARIVKHERNKGYRMIFAIASGARNPPTKSEAVDEFVREAAKLRKFENPYDPVEDPHMHRLIATAIPYAERSDKFAAGYWRPLTRAFGAWAREFSKPTWDVRYAKDRKLFRTSGQGRNRGITIAISSDFISQCREEGYLPEL